MGRLGLPDIVFHSLSVSIFCHVSCSLSLSLPIPFSLWYCLCLWVPHSHSFSSWGTRCWRVLQVGLQERTVHQYILTYMVRHGQASESWMTAKKLQHTWSRMIKMKPCKLKLLWYTPQLISRALKKVLNYSLSPRVQFLQGTSSRPWSRTFWKNHFLVKTIQSNSCIP